MVVSLRDCIERKIYDGKSSQGFYSLCNNKERKKAIKAMLQLTRAVVNKRQ